MHVARIQAPPVESPFRWFAFAIIAAMTLLYVAPAVPAHAQAESDSGAAQVASILPDSALFFAYANLDLESSQAQLAAELLQRAGLTDALLEDMMTDPSDEIPQGTEFAVVVTSIPEAPDVSVAEVSLDPLAATDDLDDGGFSLLLTSDNPQDLYQTQLESVESNVGNYGGEIMTSDHNGVTITSYVPEEGDDIAEDSSIALVGEYVVQSMYPDDIQPIVDTFAGTTPAIADDENFQSLSGLLPAEHLSLGFINGPAALDAIETAAPEVTQNLDTQSASLLDTWTAFTFSAEEAGFRLETRSLANTTPFDTMTPLDGSFLDQVPSDSLLVINGNNIDATGIVTSLAFVLAGGLIGQDPFATPMAGASEAASQDEVFASAESLLGFNLKTDFVDQLVGEFGFAISVDGSVTDPMAVPAIDAILFSEIDDVVAVQDVVSKVSFIIGAGMGDAGSIETRDVNGSQVNVIDITESGVADTAEFGVVDGELIVSIGSGLDDYVTGVDAPLSGDPGFNAVMDHLPTEYGSVTYVNLPIVLSLATDLTASFEGGGFPDADPACGDYATQDEAQAAYDEDQFENFALDQDFDGEACEDFFNPPAATPDAAANPYPNVIGLGSVSIQEDDVNGTTTFLLIGGE